MNSPHDCFLQQLAGDEGAGMLLLSPEAERPVSLKQLSVRDHILGLCVCV